MRKDLLIVALGLFAAAGTAGADVLSVPESEASAPVALPAKGSTMADVKKKFGAPRDQKAPVGGDTPKHPPITRWDYDGFVVIFEKDRVVDAVVPGAPPRLRTTAGLTPATNAPPPPDMPPPPEAEPIIPEAPASETPPPDAPAEAAAAPDAPMEPAPEEAAAPPPAEAPPAETMQPEPVVSPVPEEVPSDGPPTPK